MFSRSWLLFLVLGLAGCSGSSGVELLDLGQIRDFSLTERSGRTVTRDDLAGKVWVAGFVFTRCKGQCLQISGGMAKLQKELAGYPDVRLVSFSVDPEHDTPETLRAYAKQYGADDDRWLFLTGPKDDVHDLVRKSFFLPVEENTGEARVPGNEVLHSPRLALVDRHGHIRGYFDGRQVDDEGNPLADLEQLKKAVAQLLREAP